MTTGSPTSEVAAMCKRLRREWQRVPTGELKAQREEAATLLQSLEAENKQLRDELTKCTAAMDRMTNLVARACAALTPSNRDRT